MQFFNGTTDNSVAEALSQIQWQIRYNLLEGTSPINELFENEIGEGEQEGEFDMTAAPMSGGQVTTIQWYRDERIVRYSIKSITEPI